MKDQLSKHYQFCEPLPQLTQNKFIWMCFALVYPLRYLYRLNIGKGYFSGEIVPIYLLYGAILGILYYFNDPSIPIFPIKYISQGHDLQYWIQGIIDSSKILLISIITGGNFERLIFNLLPENIYFICWILVFFRLVVASKFGHETNIPSNYGGESIFERLPNVGNNYFLCYVVLEPILIAFLAFLTGYWLIYLAVPASVIVGLTEVSYINKKTGMVSYAGTIFDDLNQERTQPKNNKNDDDFIVED